MITIKRFARIERAVVAAGYQHIIDWSETVVEPTSAEAFAAEAIYVICNSGMKQSVASVIFQRCLRAVEVGQSATTAFGHPGKAPAIDTIWRTRDELFARYRASSNKVEFCEELPWIGQVTKFHLAKNCGVDTAKPDVHMDRLATRERKTTLQMCTRLARESAYRIATVDSILWRACAVGILNSRVYEIEGWRAAFNGMPTHVPNEDDDEADD